MMKITCFVLVVCLLAATAAAAATTANHSFTLFVGPTGAFIGENWISLPAVPLDPIPTSVFGDYFDDYRISRFDAPTQSGVGWASYDDSFNLLLGEGYVVVVDDAQDHPFSYDGLQSGVPDSSDNKTDMWISLPGMAGAPVSEHWIGHPFVEPVDFLEIQVTDGTQTIPVMDAVALGWLEGYWGYFDAATQSGYAVDPDWIMGDGCLLPWQMYKVLTYKQNIALIIPAPA